MCRLNRRRSPAIIFKSSTYGQVGGSTDSSGAKSLPRAPIGCASCQTGPADWTCACQSGLTMTPSFFVTYQGRATAATPDVAQRLAAGETLGPDQIYFLTTPAFETDAPAYAWLNQIVEVGKLVSLKRGKDRHVTYAILKST